MLKPGPIDLTINKTSMQNTFDISTIGSKVMATIDFQSNKMLVFSCLCVCLSVCASVCIPWRRFESSNPSLGI